jgi:hypothetical protein
MANAVGGQADYRGVDPTERHAVRLRQLDLGWVGYFFGPSTAAPTNIAGIVVVLFAVTTVILAFVPAKLPAMEFLTLVLPVVTLTLGYLFGKST